MEEGICPGGEFNVQFCREGESRLQSFSNGEIGVDSVSGEGEVEVFAVSIKGRSELRISDIRGGIDASCGDGPRIL